MDKLQLTKEFLTESKNTNPGQTTTAYGTAVSDSENGIVFVDMEGETVSSNDEQAIECETTFKVYSGDEVIVSLIGADGSGKTPIVIGVVGRGDQQQESIDAIKNYFWADDYGAHVSTRQQSVQGSNILLDADSLDIRRGNSNDESDQMVLARFSNYDTFISGNNGVTAWAIKGYNRLQVTDVFYGDGETYFYRTDFTVINPYIIPSATLSLTACYLEDPTHPTILRMYDPDDPHLSAFGRYTIDFGSSFITLWRSDDNNATRTPFRKGDVVYIKYYTNQPVFSFTEGFRIGNMGAFSKTQGYFNTASGAFSSSSGRICKALGNSSNADGYETIAASPYQKVFGTANIQDDDRKYINIIGNGSTIVSEQTDYMYFYGQNSSYAEKYSSSLSHDPIDILSIDFIPVGLIGDNFFQNWTFEYISSSDSIILCSDTVYPYDFTIKIRPTITGSSSDPDLIEVLPAGEDTLTFENVGYEIYLRPSAGVISLDSARGRGYIRYAYLENINFDFLSSDYQLEPYFQTEDPYSHTMFVCGDQMKELADYFSRFSFYITYTCTTIKRNNAYTLDWNGNAEFEGTAYLGGCEDNSEKPYSAIRYNTDTKVPEYFTGIVWDSPGSIMTKIDEGVLVNQTTNKDIILEQGGIYILTTNEYTTSSYAYRGHHAYLLCVPKGQLYGTTAIQSANIAASSNTGVTVTRPTTSLLQIKCSANTYTVEYCIYSVMKQYNNYKTGFINNGKPCPGVELHSAWSGAGEWGWDTSRVSCYTVQTNPSFIQLHFTNETDNVFYLTPKVVNKESPDNYQSIHLKIAYKKLNSSSATYDVNFGLLSPSGSFVPVGVTIGKISSMTTTRTLATYDLDISNWSSNLDASWHLGFDVLCPDDRPQAFDYQIEIYEFGIY